MASKYLANKNTKEIHVFSEIGAGCKYNEIKPEHKIWLDTEQQVNEYIRNLGYNGCKWCYPEKNTG
jgi:hypothetical protein